jgi:hypothetical protein
MTPKLKPEYTTEWMHDWFICVCKRFGYMVIATHYSGNELKIKAYLEEIKQLQKELEKQTDKDSKIMLKKLNLLNSHATSILKM